MTTDSLDDLKASILDLPGEDRNRLLRRVIRETDYAGRRMPAERHVETPLEAYCREYSDDPICTGSTTLPSSSATPTSVTRTRRRGDQSDRSHLRGLPSGGGSTEAWEYLSGVREGR